MKKLERDIEQKVCEWADQRNIIHTKLNIMGRRAEPDRVFWIPGGRPALIELKRKGEKPRKLQAYRLATLLALGYDAIWTDSAGTAIHFLENCVRKARKKARKE